MPLMLTEDALYSWRAPLLAMVNRPPLGVMASFWPNNVTAPSMLVAVDLDGRSTFRIEITTAGQSERAAARGDHIILAEQ